MTAAASRPQAPQAGPGHREPRQGRRADQDPGRRPGRRAAGRPGASSPARPTSPRPAPRSPRTRCSRRRAMAEVHRPAAVADDSGLCVDALNGMPGVLSARWSGTHGDDAANTAAGARPAQRRARRAARRALHLRRRAGPAGRAGARQRGHRVRPADPRAQRGSNGFGYDPIFVPDRRERTTAEMSPGGEGRDQPPGPRPARPGPGDRRRWSAGSARPAGPGVEAPAPGPAPVSSRCGSGATWLAGGV